MPVPSYEPVNGGFGYKNPLLANNRLQQALTTQDLGMLQCRVTTYGQTTLLFCNFSALGDCIEVISIIGDNCLWKACLHIDSNRRKLGYYFADIS